MITKLQTRKPKTREMQNPIKIIMNIITIIEEKIITHLRKIITRKIITIQIKIIITIPIITTMIMQQQKKS